MPLRVLTWNVNGIRALKPDLATVIESVNSDVLCFQETKITKEQLDSRLCFVPGYSSYYSWCKSRGGYSGTCVFVRDAALKVTACCDGLLGFFETANGNASAASEFGEIELDEDMSSVEKKAIDEEGRALMLKFRVPCGNSSCKTNISSISGDGKAGNAKSETDLVLINVYAPRVDGEKPELRLPFKKRFFQVLKSRINACIQRGYLVLLVGDLNLTHRDVDVREGYEARERPNEDTLMSRKWLDSLLAEHQLVDLYRHLWPVERDRGYTNWCQLVNARAFNFGCRIDYQIGSSFLVERLISCEALQNVQGSDHCPVQSSLDLECEKRKAGDGPIKSICATRSMPEFGGGLQRSILGYFGRPKAADESLSQSQSTVQLQKTHCPDRAETRNASQDVSEEPKAKKSKITQFFVKTAKPKPTEEIVIDEPDGQRLPQVDCEKPPQQNDNDSNLLTPQLEHESNVVLKQAQEQEESEISKESKRKNAFAALRTTEPRAPLCRGHSEACVLRVVKASTSANRGRSFWCCARPEGPPSNPASRCGHFVWTDAE